MSLPEIFYRANQNIQKKREERNSKLFHKAQDYNKVFNDALVGVENSFPTPVYLFNQFENYNTFDFFGQSLNLNEEIDWHLDIQSGKRFPLKFSKNIDIRSGNYGNAKLVWEINRLQFLLPLAIKYTSTNNDMHLQLWMRIMRSWVKENPYLKGINWYSNIEINIRLIVWYFCWQILCSHEEIKKNEEFISFSKQVWLPAIYDHCVYSFNNLSKYSSANNHLIAEYSGLFLAGVCWQFKETKQWMVIAQAGLEKEIVKQHSINGINREEAAEYIQFITDFFLIPFAVSQKHKINFSENYKNYLHKICSYILNLLEVKNGYAKYGDEDDGKVLITSPDPHFNNFLSILVSGAIVFDDAKFKKNNIEFDLKNWLLWGGEGRKVYDNLPQSNDELASVFYNNEGHFIFKKSYKNEPGKEIYLHFDAAPLGFLSIAAHGHADALSIILTLDGNPIFVDAGTYTYHTQKEWRKYFVSTIAHNTVCIDDVNQAEYVGPTMWLQHYNTNVLHCTQNDDKEVVSAKHSGYSKINCENTRTVEFNRKEEYFNITDNVIVDNKPHKILQPWHLHPKIIVEKIGEHTYILQYPGADRKIKAKFSELLDVAIIKGQTSPIVGWYSSSFLQKEPTTVFYGSIKSFGSSNIILSTFIQII